MLAVPAFQLSDPVSFAVLAKTDNLSLHSGYNPTMRNACMLAMTGMAQEEPGKVFSAIRENNLAQLKTLNTNAADERGITPLMYAAEIAVA